MKVDISNLAILFILVSCTISFKSCKSDNVIPCILEDVKTPFVAPCKTTKNLDTIKMLIKGTWTWLQEERPIRGLQITKYLTPKTEGYSLDLKLHGDTATYYKCSKVDETYRFAIIRLKEISGTNFPEDEDPVLIFYDLKTGLRDTHVPLKICPEYLILQYQYVRSIEGENTWKRKQ